MQYTYEQNRTGNMELVVTDGTNTVAMIIGTETPEHLEMIEMFTDEEKLDKYAQYLWADPNRSFDIEAIRAL